MIVSLGIMPWNGYHRHKSWILIRSRSFRHGSILAETIDAERIEHIVKPVKDLFGAIFFVSVGHVNRSAVLWEYKIPILILTLVVMTGQILLRQLRSLTVRTTDKNCHTVWFFSRANRRIRLHHRMFGTIIKRNRSISSIRSSSPYQLITTFFTPYMIRIAEPACQWATGSYRRHWRTVLERYSSGSNTIRQKSAWNKLLKALGPHSRHLYSRLPLS